ncbi:MAG: hypothetical protein U0X76_04670 [Bacteroidia bacterium]
MPSIKAAPREFGTQPFRTNFVALDGTRITPAICYESVYGGFMSGYMRDTLLSSWES